MFRTGLFRTRLWSRCALLWSFRRDHRGAVTQSCPCVCARDSISRTDPDVRGEICVMLDQLPVVVPRSAAVPLVDQLVAQTRPRGGSGSNLLLPVDMSIEPLDDDDGPDVIISGRESTVVILDVVVTFPWSRISVRLWCPKRRSSRWVCLCGWLYTRCCMACS